MLIYSARDIINRALQLSDLQNSDFIGDDEKLSLLNECWTMLYQKLINSGDKTFIKRCRVCNNCALPANLYQISSIYQDKDKEPVPKMNSAQKSGYDIIGDQLVFSTEYGFKDLIMEYYPNPDTIFLKDKEIESPYPDNMVGAYKTIYVTDDLTVKDLEDPDTSLEIPIADVVAAGKDAEYKNVQVFKNAILFDVDTIKVVVSLVSGKISAVSEDLVIPLVRENTLYFYSDELKAVLDIGMNTIVEDVDFMNGIVTDKKAVIIYSNEPFTKVFVIYDGQYYMNTKGFLLPAIAARLMYGRDGLYAITRTGSLIKLTDEGIVMIHVDALPKMFTSDIRMLTTKGLSGTKMLEGITQDSDIAYPSNLFFSLIAYMLAKQFKSKQGSDTAQLDELLLQAQTQFFDSLNRDFNSSYTIKDVYKNNRGYRL